MEAAAVYDRDGQKFGTIERLMLKKKTGTVAYTVPTLVNFLYIRWTVAACSIRGVRMPIAVWLLAAALFCFFGERFVLSFWLIIMASVDALLEIVVAKRWPKIGSLLYEIDLTTRNGLVNGTVKLLLTALLCVVAWSLSVLTSPFLEYFADLVAQILRKP